MSDDGRRLSRTEEVDTKSGRHEGGKQPTEPVTCTHIFLLLAHLVNRRQRFRIRRLESVDLVSARLQCTASKQPFQNGSEEEPKHVLERCVRLSSSRAQHTPPTQMQSHSYIHRSRPYRCLARRPRRRTAGTPSGSVNNAPGTSIRMPEVGRAASCSPFDVDPLLANAAQGIPALECL